MINRNERFYVVIFLVLSILALVSFGWMDLEFSQSVYAPAQWTWWVENLAFLPAFLAAWLESLLLTAYCFRIREGKVPALPLVIGFLSSVGLPIYAYWQVMQFLGRESGSDGWIMLICFLALAIWAGMRIIRDLSLKEEKKRINRALAGLLIFYTFWGLSLLLTYFWGRVSFREMAKIGDFGAFTPWFRPGSSRGSSMAPTTLALSFGVVISNYLTSGHNRNQRNLLMLAGLIYGLLIGWAALRNGSVYGSEITLMALLTFGVTLLGGFLFRKIRPRAAGEALDIRHDGF